MRCRHVVATILLTIVLGGCPRVKALGQGEARATGEVKHLPVEGGCWQFMTDSGVPYQLVPGKAPADLLTDGRKATIVFKPLPDMMTTCQVGQPIEVVRVE